MVKALLEPARTGAGATRLEAVKVGLAYLYGKPDSVQLEDLSDEEILAVVMRRKDEASR